MHNSKLHKYLSTFSKGEWKEFRNYLKGSIGDHSEAYRLYLLFEAQKRNLDSPKTSIAYLLKSNFQQVTRKSVLNLMSVLKNEIDEFWTIQELENDKLAKDLYWLKALNRRGFHKEANKVGDSITTLTSSDDRLYLWDSYYKIAANHELYFSQNPIKNSISGAKRLKELISEIDELKTNLVLYYRATLVNRENLNRENQQELINSISLNLNNPSMLSSLLVEFNNLFEDDCEEAMRAHTALIKNDIIDISEDLSMSFSIILWRVLTEKFKAGSKESGDQLANIALIAFENNTFLYQGYSSFFQLINLFVVILTVRGIETAEKFYAKALPFISPNDKDEIDHLIQLMLLFANSEYDKLISNIAGFEKAPIRTKAYQQNLLLKAYYELYKEDTNFLLNRCRNYDDFFRRNKHHFSKKSTRGNILFSKILRMIINKIDKEKLISQLEKDSADIFYPSWLSEKIEKLD